MSFSGTKGYITKPKPGVMLNPLHPLSQDIVGYWLLNEGSGSMAYDISGHGNHGALINMSPNAQDSGWCGDKYGGGLFFDKTNDHVDCGNSKTLDVIDNFAITAIFRSIDGADQGIFGTLKNDGTAGYALYMRGSDNKITFRMGTGSGSYDVDSNNEITDKKFHIVTALRKNGTNYMYIDNVKQTQISTDTFSSNIAAGFTFGRSYNAWVGQILDGQISAVIIQDSIPDIALLHYNPFCNLLQTPLRRYSVSAPPPISAYAGLMMQMIKHDKVIL